MSVPIPHIIKTDITAVKLFGNIVLAGIVIQRLCYYSAFPFSISMH